MTYNPSMLNIVESLEKQPVSKGVKLACFVVMTALLYISFYNNPFGIVDKEKFLTYQKFSDALVINRLVQNNSAGSIFDKKGIQAYGKYILVIIGDFPEVEKQIDVQEGLRKRHYYFYTKIFENYFSSEVKHKITSVQYFVNFGLQGWIFSFIDVGLKFFGLEPHSRYKYMKRLLALTLALTLSAMVFFLAIEFGRTAGVLAFISIFISPIFIFFSKSLYWIFPLFLLPFLWCWYFYVRHAPPLNIRSRNYLVFAAGFFILAVTKMLLGFEYASVHLVAAGAALVYGLCKVSFNLRIIFMHSLLLVANAIAAFITAFTITLYSNFDNISHGLKFFVGRSIERPYKNDKDMWDKMYDILKEVVRNVGISNIYLMLFFIAAVLFVVAYSRQKRKNSALWQNEDFKKLASLFILMSLLLAASLSWFIVFPTHALNHRRATGHISWSVSAIMPALFWVFWERSKSYILKQR